MRIQCCRWSDRRRSSGSNASDGERLVMVRGLKVGDPWSKGLTKSPYFSLREALRLLLRGDLFLFTNNSSKIHYLAKASHRSWIFKDEQEFIRQKRWEKAPALPFSCLQILFTGPSLTIYKYIQVCPLYIGEENCFPFNPSRFCGWSKN